MFAIAVNALYITLRRRGTTRQLAGTIVTCVISALLLLPAMTWYDMRFTVEQAAISVAEVELALVYVALFGWVLPLSVTASYCLFTLPRTSTTSVHIPRQKRTTRANTTALDPLPPRFQAGVQAPYVYRESIPWGWLVYRGGRFQGQRLALERTVVTIGRGEENDIWLDDDLASRNHAELAWNEGSVYITDCDSLNGVLLNGHRIRRPTLVQAGELLEIGSHRFLFEKAEQPGPPAEQDDPLLRHVWHSSSALLTDSEKLSMAQSVQDGTSAESSRRAAQFHSSSPAEEEPVELQDTAQLNPISPPPQTLDLSGVLIVRDGEMAGQSFVLDRPVITIGRGSECDVAINDASISRRHAQVLRQANGNYVQDLASRNGTKVNDQPLLAPQLLQVGDIVCLGNVRVEYTATSLQEDPNTPMPMSLAPASFVRPVQSGPVKLNLPSRPKNQ
jgi:pSer/pThr/pTyr-binding forkhead associated (FHA) protein